MKAVIAKDKDNVAVWWGDLISVKDIDISKYKDIKEEDDDMSQISYGYLHDLFPDVMEADTTAVDSTVVE